MVVEALRELGLVVSDDGTGRPGVTRIDRGWRLELVDHADAGGLVGDEGRIGSMLRLTGEYKRRHGVVDELRAADDVVALTTSLPLVEGVLALRDRDTVQDAIVAEAAIDVIYIDEAGEADIRDRVLADARRVAVALNDPRALDSRPNADGVTPQRATGKRLDPRRLVTSFDLLARLRPGTGARWGHLRAALDGAAIAIGWVPLDDAGEPAEVFDQIQIDGRAAIRLRSLAGATFTHAGGWIVVELDFDIISEAS